MRCFMNSIKSEALSLVCSGVPKAKFSKSTLRLFIAKAMVNNKLTCFLPPPGTLGTGAGKKESESLTLDWTISLRLLDMLCDAFVLSMAMLSALKDKSNSHGVSFAS